MKGKAMDYKTAREIFMNVCETLDEEEISLEKAAGRVLSRDIYALLDVPPFARSPFDGYALRAEDTIGLSKEQPKTFTIITEVAAGGHFEGTLGKDEAVKILTGAPVPDGATAVIKYEDTEFTDTHVTIFQQCDEQENVIPSGEDVKKDALIAKKGERISPAIQGMIAAQGLAHVYVYKAPMIGLISLGDELLEVGQPIAPGKIYNTNRYLLNASLKKECFNALYLGNIEDNEKAIIDFLKEAVCIYDILITTGGASVGDYDFAKRALVGAGGELCIERVAMKPGSSCGFGLLNDTPVICLSGNPAAAMTTFYMVAMPGIRKVAGLEKCLPDEIQVELANDFNKKSPNTRILKGTLDLTDGTVKMQISEAQGNGMVSSMKDVDVFAVIPAGSGPVKKGTKLSAYQIK